MAEPFYRSIIWTAIGLFKGLGLKFDVVGTEHIPAKGGAILAINHTSFLDFALAGYPANDIDHRVVRFMAKDGIFKHPVAGPMMRGMRHISVDRDNGLQAFREAVDALKAGELVGIFPEATMSRSFDIKEMKNGAIRMAIAANVPVIPMIVFGGHRVLSYDHKDFSRGKTIAITIGEPTYPQRGDDTEALNEQLRETLRSLLAETVARYPMPDDPANAWWLPARFGGAAPTLDEATVIEERVREEKIARKKAEREAKAAKAARKKA